MNRHLSILLLFCVYSHVYAQTPYDAFAPEVSRPILDVVQNLDAYQPRTLYDIMSGRMNLYWDANGNIAEMIHCEQDAGRFHEWDEDNRLRFVLGERFAGYYGYDANGERVYKLTGTCGIDQINHNGTRAYVMFDDAVLYPNPYLVVTPRGYTKHYYAGTERLATAIGSGGFDDMGLTIGHYDSREEDIAQMFYANYQNEDPFYYDHILSEMIGTSTIEGDNMPELEYRREPIILGRVDVIGGENLLYSSIEDNLPVRDRERELFFSHSDHLGSANWITDYDGVPIQYLHYAPYGELVENQRVTDYDERYKFTGKERDWETGYDMFGARYWWLAGTWLSVDPLSDKYPQISPYAYCMWNPITNQDPNGCGDPLTVMKVRRMKINNTFGMVRCYPDGSPKNHQGIDYYAPVGTDIMAVKDGIVVGCDLEGKGDYGKTITLQFEDENGKNAWAFYSHLSEIDVNVNDQVKEGDVIGKTGITGNANNLKGEDQHLHFEYRTGGARLGKGLNGRDDPNLIVDTKFEPDPNNMGKVRYKED